MFKTLRMARSANQIRQRFEGLWDSPDAYRPEVPKGTTMPPRLPAMHALHALSSFANQRRATSGDAGVLAVDLLDAIDECESYADGFDSTMTAVADGTLRSVTGVELRTLLSRVAVAEILEAIGSAGRTEAWTNYVTAEHGNA
jgi:hypothetical protein